MPSKRQNVPRTDPYLKLLYRLYEPLILLFELGQTRGDHVFPPRQVLTQQARRRRLQSNLAYLCDFDKGGTTTTALAIEDHEHYYQFWIGCNDRKSGGRIRDFMRDQILAALGRIVGPSDDNSKSLDKQDLVENCTRFAAKRIKKEIKLLSASILECKKHLDSSIVNTGTDLRSWMESFEKVSDHHELCNLAYRERKCPEMAEVKRIVQRNWGDSGPSTIANDSFYLFQHYIGRLAHHIRAPRQVIEDATHLHRFFGEFRVTLVDVVVGNPLPPVDSRVNLSGILTRMCEKEDPKLFEYEEALQNISQRYGVDLENDVIKRFNDNSGSAACVHCEIQVLEHFHKNKHLKVADGDLFIGCSKPACFCCRLYFQHHPSRPVVPESHQKIWINWGFPGLKLAAKDPEFFEQRRVLDKVIKGLRDEAKDHIMKRKGRLPFHPDSRTGITSSVKSYQHLNATLGVSEDSETWIEDDFAALSLGGEGAGSTNDAEEYTTSPNGSGNISSGYHGSSTAPSVRSDFVDSISEGEILYASESEDSDTSGGVLL